MAQLVYSLCALTSLLCAVLLLSSYRRRRTRLLLWSSLCFVGLTLTNALLVIDFLIGPAVDLSLVRAVTGLLSVSLLLVGLIWDV